MTLAFVAPSPPRRVTLSSFSTGSETTGLTAKAAAFFLAFNARAVLRAFANLACLSAARAARELGGDGSEEEPVTASTGVGAFTSTTDADTSAGNPTAPLGLAVTPKA
jgi:hypothetical protein